MYENGEQVGMQAGEPPLPKDAADELKKEIKENGGQIIVQAGNEVPPLPKEAGDELIRQMEENDGNDGLIQTKSSGRGTDSLKW